MAAIQSNTGTCVYCGRTVSRGGMGRHLRMCGHRMEIVDDADSGAGARTPLLHLLARGGPGDEYWLHLEADGRATLGELDRFLRAIWLECCGHGSRMREAGVGGRALGVGLKLARAFRPGREIVHEYDPAAPTVTRVKVIGVREGTRTTHHPIALMARNTPPPDCCAACDLPATHVCPACVAESRAGAFCAAHARVHARGGCTPLALANSPRSGLCGYHGPADPPAGSLATARVRRTLPAAVV